MDLPLSIRKFDTHVTACTRPQGDSARGLCGFGKDALAAVRDLRGRLAQDYQIYSAHFMEAGDAERAARPSFHTIPIAESGEKRLV